jgi:hypothetical protein
MLTASKLTKQDTRHDRDLQLGESKEEDVHAMQTN